MKKLLFFCAFILAAGMVSGQACTKAEKAACKKAGKSCIKTASTADNGETKVASAMVAADIAAESDENIVRKQCEYTGNISYYKKSVCEKSGKVSMEEVNFDEESQSFVNVSPSELLSQQEAKAMQTSVKSASKSKKACCAGKKAKSCAKGKEGA